MIELRKTELFAEWLDGLADLRARARVQARLERWQVETQEMFSRLAKVFQSCELIIVPVTGCISSNEGAR